MQLPYSDELNIEKLSRLFEHKSESYKLFWFKAIMTRISDGQSEMTFNDLINDMIIDAWYMVTEYHLNLGPADGLEKIVKYLQESTDMASTSKPKQILDYLHRRDDKDVIEMKRVLTLNVPYRLQAPLLNGFDGWSKAPKSLAEAINKEKGLIYYFEEINGLDSIIMIDPSWKLYLIKNQAIIKGWIDYNLIIYLQRRNPNVPGISDKLYPPTSRKLGKVKKYWECIAEINGGLSEIYGNMTMYKGNISIDHFVPWSFVAHDELWNLSPTTKSINSSKSNNLPKWDEYFPKLAALEYDAYRITIDNSVAREIFEACAREHLNDLETMSKLYCTGHTRLEFTNRLEEILQPAYNAAKNCGFTEWICA